VHPIVVVLLDGLADRAHASLGGRTANEVADTPNLDRLAANGSTGVLYSLGPGRAPSSELAHWAILGYRLEEFPGRAVFEALGAGQDVSADHVLAYAALRPADVRGGELWLTGRPRYGDEEEEARRLIQACDDLEIEGLRFSLAHTRRGEAVLRVQGGADDRVTDTDAFFRDRHPVLRPQALVPEAARTARAAEAWTRAVIDKLGGERFNVITLKWWGRLRPVPSFEQRHGLRGTFVAESAFLRGLARCIGLHSIDEAEGDQPAADLRRRFDRVEERLSAGDDFVFVHLKATDVAGHSKDPRVKRATIEALDTELGTLRVLAARAVVCVTGDHATPTYPDVIHSGDPVPFLLAGPGVRADAVQSYGELECAGGILGHLRGEDVMPVLLNAADRPLFAGSRPTPYAGADGYPSLLEPLRIR
jgi:2,3-bisphosphoglycerate-independent phosphoglycerate mutase